MTARLARLIDKIVAESAEYAEHAGHVRAGVYRAHARVRALALQARRHLADGVRPEPVTDWNDVEDQVERFVARERAAGAKGRARSRISAREAAADADVGARRAARFGPVSLARERVYIKSVKDSNKRRPTRRRKG